MTEILTIIFNKSLSERDMPNDRREANVIPSYKNGKKSDIKNYRPVSLTSQVCKILESLIKDSIVAHLDKYSIIKSSQHGFLSGRSCTTNLLEYMEFITKNIDDGLPVDTLFLDFSKAFDRVPHQRLLIKLKSYGISDSLHSWIKCWLTRILKDLY